GNDTVVGNGGPDVLYGAPGDDVLAVSDATFARIDGGTGLDTLRLDGPGFALDLTDRTLAYRLQSIEAIDLSGPGNFTLTLDALAVLDMSEMTNTLVVTADAGDPVQIGTGWTPGSPVVIGGQVYNVYNQGLATLELGFVNTAPSLTKTLSAILPAIDEDD